VVQVQHSQKGGCWQGIGWRHTGRERHKGRDWLAPTPCPEVTVIHRKQSKFNPCCTFQDTQGRVGKVSAGDAAGEGHKGGREGTHSCCSRLAISISSLGSVIARYISQT
jgi:hypothetical protein